MFNLNNDSSKLNPSEVICHSGGAIGSDTVFRNKCLEYKCTVVEYSYKTEYHKSPYKKEITESEFKEGVEMVNKANKIMKRYNILPYMNLLARNWYQVKNRDVVYAIGTIIESNQKNKKGYYNKSEYQQVDGGTGYAVQMAILKGISVYVFDQEKDSWYKYSYNTHRYIKCDAPKIERKNFCGIGTREINNLGIQAIENLFKKTFC